MKISIFLVLAVLLSFGLQGMRALANEVTTPPGGTGGGSTAEPPAEEGSLDEARRLLREARYDDAERVARRVLAEAQVAKGADSIEAAEALDLLVENRWRAGKGLEKQTMALIERALRIKEQKLDSTDPGLATSLNFKGLLLKDAGDLPGARLVFERALRIREQALGPENPDVAASQSNLGNVLMEVGDYAGAQRLYESALVIQQKAFGPEDIRVARTLNRLAILLRTVGDYDGSRPLYERALAITRSARGPDHADVAGILNGLAILLVQMGDFAGARQHYDSALAIRVKAYGLDHYEVAVIMNNLGSVLVDMGGYEEARTFLEKALLIRRESLGAEHPHVATTLSNLAELHFYTGDLAAAGSFYEDALRILRARLGPVEVASGLIDLATVTEARGDVGRALELHEQALAISERAFPSGHEVVALSLNSVARIRSATGDEAGARVLYQRALAMWEKAFGPEHPAVAETLVGLGEVLSRSGEAQAAFDDALRAEEISRSHVRLTARSLPESQALAFSSIRASGLDLALRLAAESPARSPGIQRRAWDALVRSRALVLDEMASRHRDLTESDDPEVARLAAALQAARTRLANLTVRGSDPDHPEVHRKLLDQTRKDVQVTERSLASLSLSFRREVAGSRVGLGDATANLPPSSALVAYALHGGPRGAAGWSVPVTAAGRDPAPTYLAFVIRHGEQEATAVPIGAAREIDALVSSWRQQSGQKAPGRSPPERLKAEYRLAGEALRRKVWDPVSGRIGSAELVFIVPDGALGLVNFASLPIGDSRYLVEDGPPIHYLSAERDLVTYAATTPKGSGLLVLGGPDFEKASPVRATPSEKRAPSVSGGGRASARGSFRGRSADCVDFRNVRFEQLSASAREAAQVTNLWRGDGRSPRDHARRGSAGSATYSEEVIRLVGDEATEAAFKKQAPGRQVLHLATHGFFLGGRCQSALDSPRGVGGLAPVGEGLHAAPAGENPLLLSGLAFAGANRRLSAGAEDEDGILTAEEIAVLDLSGVVWAVLSACDTAVGPIEAGEGVFGLRRAFQIAGVRTLIMSLWPIGDEAAREWMQALYEKRFVEQLGTSDAVHQATLKSLRQRRSRGQSTHPFYWAGFVAAGDWR